MRDLKIRCAGGGRGRQPAHSPPSPPPPGQGLAQDVPPAHISPIYLHGALLARLHLQGLWGWPGLAGHQGRLPTRLQRGRGECCPSMGCRGPPGLPGRTVAAEGGPGVPQPRGQWSPVAAPGARGCGWLGRSRCLWAMLQPGVCPAKLTQFNRETCPVPDFLGCSQHLSYQGDCFLCDC